MSPIRNCICLAFEQQASSVDRQMSDLRMGSAFNLYGCVKSRLSPVKANSNNTRLNKSRHVAMMILISILE